MMVITKLGIAILICVFGGSFGGRISSIGLKFSDHYESKGILTVPQAEIREPFHAWFDLSANTSRIDFYDGSVKTYQFAQLGKFGSSIQIVPVKDLEDGSDYTCWRLNGTESHKVVAQSVLPDVTDFTLIGDDFIGGVSAEKWERRVTQYSVKSRYTLWVRYKNGGTSEEKIAIPVRYEVKGINDVLSSRYDHFFLDYDWFSNRDIDPETFEIPKDLEGKCEDTNSAEKFALSNPMREYINGEDQNISEAFEKFKRRYGRHYASATEEALRRMIFTENYRFIMSTNRANRRFTVAINHLADRSPEEIRSHAVPLNISEIAEDEPEILYSDTMFNNTETPSKFDWVMQGAVTQIRDVSDVEVIFTEGPLCFFAIIADTVLSSAETIVSS